MSQIKYLYYVHIHPEVSSLNSFIMEHHVDKLILFTSSRHAAAPAYNNQPSVISDLKCQLYSFNDTSVSLLGGILGSDPPPHTLFTGKFSVLRIELKLCTLLCLYKEEKAAGLHIYTIESLHLCNTLDRVGHVFITEVM